MAHQGFIWAAITKLTNRRKYHNRTIHGPMREEQAYLKRRVRERVP
jgi:hypothetical protein